jgi:hypothetical protein
MKLGMHLRELSRLRIGLVLSVFVAALAAVWSVAAISLSPPRLTPRALDIASAETQVVVDTPYSTVVDLRQGVNDIDPLTQRALLVGTLMSTEAVREDIAKRAHLAPERLQVVAPRTPDQPRPTAQSGEKKGPGDLLQTTDQYRLDIESNPTIPLLSIIAQAPTAAAAARLANSAVSGLRDYVNELVASERTPDDVQITLRQLGSAHGEVVNHGVQPQVAAVVFMLVLALSCATSIVIARVRRGWRVAVAAES